MTLAGKHGIGVISLGSMQPGGLNGLHTQWGYAEEAAKKYGKVADRKQSRILLTWHVAETREQAAKEAGKGLMHWHNEYTVKTLQRPNTPLFESPEQAVDMTAGTPGTTAVIGTPDDLVKMIRNIQQLSGGFGAVIGFVHDWANPEATARSWDLVARYVVPEINGYVENKLISQNYLRENRQMFERAGAAVMKKIMENEKAVVALKETQEMMAKAGAAHTPIPTTNAPDMKKAKTEA
jgi:limonene 1,2-monooxygenase